MKALSNDELYNREAEEYLIGVILVAPEQLIKIKDKIKPGDIFSKALRLIYNVMLDMDKGGKAIDIVTLSEELKFRQELDTIGGRSTINNLALSVETTKQVEQNCKIVSKYSKKRQLISISNNIEQDILNGVDVDDITKDVLAKATDIMTDKSKANLQSIASEITNVMDEVDAILASNEKIFGLSTGFFELDRTISGLCKSKLYILGARPRVGKSALAQQIAEHIAKTKNVIFFSLEMKRQQYTKRSLFRRTGINNEVLSNGIITREQAMDELAQHSDDLLKLNLLIDDNSDCTLSSVEKAILLTIQERGSCDLIVIDYAQLMMSNDKSLKDPFQIAAKNSTGLKKLANKYNIPIFLLCQLNRQLEARADKRPLLSDLKDTGSYEQDADVIMFLYRDELYNNDPRNRGKAELIVAKNREGSCRIIPMLFNGSKTEFKEYVGM